MRIFLTGGRGFIGSNFAEKLLNQNNYVTIFDNLSSGFKKFNNYKKKFNKFIRNNNFVYKNFFLNEFIRNIERFQLSADIFDNFIREVLFKINISNFLITCHTFEGNREITLDNYIEVISAISKSTQNSKEKNVVIINFFKKLDKNNLFLRLFDIY